MRYLSLFDGIGAVHAAWQSLGWTCVATAEIDAFPAAVVEHHHGFPNLGDVTQITDAQIAALGPIDLVVGGSPCQDLSVAGKRKGMAGARSGLFYDQLRIFHAARTHCGARLLLWENVPGAFSTHAGRDFACVVGAMAGCEIVAPADGWRSEGVAVGANGLVEWCVLDAQWFGVAQRRRRVFAVLDVGAWADRAPILLEPESLRGDSAPRRETWEGVAGSIAARTRGGGGLGTDFECDGGLIPSTGDLSHCLNAGGMGRQDYETKTLVTHSLRADGFDASEDGTGRGTPLVPVDVMTLAIRGRGDSHDLEVRQDGTANAILTPNGGRGGIGVGAIAFDPQGAGKQSSLGASEHGTGALGTTKTPAVAFAQNQRDEVRTMDVAGALAGEPGMKQQTYAHVGMQVRRLTPRECERLQGFPDDYTAIQVRGKPAADGPRYKALGNSMAVPVMRWIGERIAATTTRIEL